MRLELLKARAYDAAAAVRERVPSINLSAFKQSVWRPPLSFSAAILIAALAMLPIYGCHVKGERDQWWISEIRAKSGRVTEIVKDGDVAIAHEDASAIKELEDDHDRRIEEAKELERRRSEPISEACDRCRIPAERLWLQ